MAKVTTYTCDRPGCDQINQKTGGWIIAVRSKDRLYFIPLDKHETVLEQKGKEAKVLCSRDCAQKMLDAYLNDLVVKAETPKDAERVTIPFKAKSFDEARASAHFLDDPHSLRRNPDIVEPDIVEEEVTEEVKQ